LSNSDWLLHVSSAKQFADIAQTIAKTKNRNEKTMNNAVRSLDMVMFFSIPDSERLARFLKRMEQQKSIRKIQIFFILELFERNRRRTLAS